MPLNFLCGNTSQIKKNVSRKKKNTAKYQANSMDWYKSPDPGFQI